MGASSGENPFVRRFIIRHWRQQRQLAKEIEPFPSLEMGQELGVQDENITTGKNSDDRVVFFISDEENQKPV